MAHVIAQHSYGTVRREMDNEDPLLTEITDQFVCATCRESFATRTDLMVHEAQHGMHVCFVCSAQYNTFRELSRHSARCRPRRVPTGGPARLPIRLQQLAHSNSKQSAVENKVKRGRKKSKTGRSIAPKKVVTHSKKEATQLKPTKVDTVQKKSKNRLPNEETTVKLVKNKFENVAAIVEMQAATIKLISDNEISIHHKKVGPLKKKSINGPPIEETTVQPFQNQSKNGGSNVETEAASINNNCENMPSPEQTEVNSVTNDSKSEPQMGTIEESTVTLVQKEIINKPTIEEFEIVDQKELKNKPSTEETEMELRQKQPQNEPSIDNCTVECTGELRTSQSMITDTDGQIKTTVPAPELTTGNDLQNAILNEDESSDTWTKRQNVDEMTSQSSVNSSETSQGSLDIIPTNTPCKEPKPGEPDHQLITHRTEHESLENLDQEETISNIDEIGQSMKVHLAINPLSEDPVLLENTMDIDNVNGNSGCGSKLLNMTSEISDNSVTR